MQLFAVADEIPKKVLRFSRSAIKYHFIFSQVEQQFGSIGGQGGQTLTLLTSAISQSENNKMCFVHAKTVIDNATLVSQQALTAANEAYTVFWIMVFLFRERHFYF